MNLNVKKRDGGVERFSVEKINKVIGWSVEGLNGCNLSDIEINAKINMRDGITTKEIHQVLVESAVGLIKEETPNYQYAASRLVSYQLRKDIWGGKNPPHLFDFVKKNVERGHYDKTLLDDYSEKEWSKLNDKINHDRDFNLTYAGIKQLCDKYLVQNLHTKEIHETPQFAYMLIAAAGFAKYDRSVRMDYVKRAYDAFSKHKINLPTPVMCGVRTPFNSFASCCLIDVADNLNSILASANAVGIATGRRYGIGVNLGGIRAIGSPVDGGRVTHTGVIPFAKHFESAVKACMQGTRGGSGTAFFPIFHYEIQDVLQLKNNAGTDDTRVRKLDYGITISKLFYDRFLKNQNITLFSPHDVKEAYDAFGTPAFDDLYIKAENNKKITMRKSVPARELFALLVKERIETGRIYILNIDHANSHGCWTETVRQSNLCMEIVQSIKPINDFNDPDGEIGVCILGALNMLECKTEEDIAESSELIVRFLDELIDKQTYFNPAAKNFATKRRSLGIGLTNLAAWLARQGTLYTDKEAPIMVDEYTEQVYYYLTKASVQLAKEKGACEKFNLTKYAKGELPIDNYKKDVDSVTGDRKLAMDWDTLRKDMAQYGMRHSTVGACMPVESSSVISNSTNGLEPVRNRMSIKVSKKGRIVQLAPGNKNWKYQTAFQTQGMNKGIIDIAAVVQKYVDMAISTNLYYNPTHYEDNKLPDAVVHKDHLYAYKMGLKSLYYANTNDGHQSSSNIEKDSSCAGGGCAL